MSERKKKCSMCGVEKPVSAFSPKSFRCKPCHREYMRERRRKKKLIDPGKVHADGPAMDTNEVFDALYEDEALKHWIKTEAVIQSRGDWEEAKDFMQEAWGAIAQCMGGKSIGYYKEIARKKIEHCRWKNRASKLYQLDPIEEMDSAEYATWKSGVRR